MSDFEIKRPGQGRAINIVIPFACKRGVGIMRDDADVTLTDGRAQGKLAAARVVGLVTRDVTVEGVTEVERAGVYPGRIEQPFKAGQECTLDPIPEAIEAEGSNYLYLSGTGALDGNTASGAKLSYIDGKLRVAQSGEDVIYHLSNQMTPETAGQVRIFAERVF